MTTARTTTRWPRDVRTLSIDVGGSGLKAAVLDSLGEMITDRVRVDTPYPCPPERLIAELTVLTSPLEPTGWHRVSTGFPGLVRSGRVLNIPSLSRRKYGGKPDPELEQAWYGFDLTGALAEAYGVPTKVVNDADMQGCAVVEGRGMEFVLTLGTGAGTALFYNGALLPHLELGHAPFRDGGSVEDYVGNVARERLGNDKWSKQVMRALKAYHDYLFYDRVYLGGGNAKHLTGPLPANAVVIPNTAGILGGLRIWEIDTAGA